MKDTLQSPTWWISVVVVGIVLNVGSSYLKGYIDRTRRKRRRANLAKNQEAEELKDRRADMIRGNPYAIIVHLQRALDQRIRGLGFTVIGFVAVITAISIEIPYSLGMLIVGGFFIGTGTSFATTANEMSDVATRACQTNGDEEGENCDEYIDGGESPHLQCEDQPD